MSHTAIRRAVPLGLFVLAAYGVTDAQEPPDPGLSYIYPPAVRAGETTGVRLAGSDWTPDLDILLHDPQVRLELIGRRGPLLVPEPPFVTGPKAYSPPPLPREQRARITVPAGYPAGPVYWQVANANGCSRPGMFFVTAGPELIEPADRRDPIGLESLPVTISGRLRRNEEIDRYTFVAESDDPVTCTLWARRIGSNFRGVVEVRDEAGRLIADRADTRGRDVELTVAVRRGRPYQVAVRELDFRGHRSYVYRLGIRPGPRILATIPASVERGRTTRVRVLLDTGEQRPAETIRTIAAAADASGHVTLKIGGASVAVPATDIPEAVEPAAGGEVALPGLPAAVTGRLETADEVDVIRFEGTRDRRVRLEVFAARIGSTIDASLEVFGPDGKRIATADDSGGTTDPSIALKLPADGRYTVRLRDLGGRTLRHPRVYRLVVRPEAPGFSVTTSQQVKLRIGGQVEVPVKAVRRGGFDGPIRLEVSGLPDGVSITAGTEIPPGKSEVKLKFEAVAEAGSLARLIGITATGRISEVDVTRVVLAAAGVNLAPRDPAEDTIPGILLTTTMKPRTSIRPVESDERTVHRGSTHLAPIRVNRLEGYQGEVLVQLDGTQPSKFRQGILAPDVILPADRDVVFTPCFVPRMAETLDAYRVAFVAITPVKDPTGRTRFLLSKMNPNTSVAITVEGGLLTLGRTGEAPIRVPAGRGFTLPVRLLRSPKLVEPVRLEVRMPPSLAGRLTSRPVTTNRAGRIELAVQLSAGGRIRGRHLLGVRAVALQPAKLPRLDETSGNTPLEASHLAILKSGHLPVIAEVQVQVDFGP